MELTVSSEDLEVGLFGRFVGTAAHIDAAAGLDAILPVGDNHLARLKIIINDRRCLIESANLDRALLHHSIFADHECVGPVRSLLDGCDRHGDNITANVDFDANPAFGAFVCARAGLVCVIGDRQTWRVGGVAQRASGAPATA